MKHVAFLIILIFFGEESLSQVPVRQTTVDLVLLNDGTRLRGAVVSDNRGQDLQMLLRGQWLGQHAPEVLRAIVPPTTDSKDGDSVASMLKSFVDELKAQPNPDVQRIGYLEERLIDLEDPPSLQTNDVPDLVVVSIPAKLVRRKFLQNSSQQNLAGLAILNGIENVEELSKADVTSQLQAIPANRLVRQIPGYNDSRDVDPTSVDKSRTAQRELQKVLVRADRVLGTTCRLIYQAGQYVDEKKPSAGGLQALTADMMMGQLQSQLQSLLSEDFSKPAGNQTATVNSGLKKLLPAEAALIADQQQADVVEVSEMKIDVSTGSASVQIGLYDQLPGQDAWTLVATAVGRATSQDVSADQQQRIADDPTVKQVTQLFSGLGSGQSSITRAISVGAAVEVAQQRAKQALEDALQSGPAVVSRGLTILKGSIPMKPDAD